MTQVRFHTWHGCCYVPKSFNKSLRHTIVVPLFTFSLRSFSMDALHVIKMIQDNEVKFADLRFTDTRGKEQHVSIPARLVTEEWFEDGHPFDGSSIAGWKGIHASAMLLKADPGSAHMDP